VNVTVLNAKGESNALNGHNCRGFYGATHGFVSVMCDASAGQVMFFDVTRNDKPTFIKDGAMLLGFQPMQVPGGSTSLNIADHGGRSHYYVLLKKAAM
jgi:hypothetical protein